MDIDSSAEIGYGKPPKRTRFQKGVSGNPKGRPKGRRNLVTVLAETLEEKIVINENGVKKTVAKLEAALKQLVNKATSGDPIALRQLIALARSAEERPVEQPTQQLSDLDLKIMERVLQRQAKGMKGETDEDH